MNSHRPAPTISPERLEAYRRHARERELQRQQALEQRKARALSAASEAADLLKREYGATRVVLYGSLAHGAWWSATSDIDLAAEGIPPHLFWRAWGAIEGLAPGIELNLAPFETLKESVKRSIAREGIEL